MFGFTFGSFIAGTIALIIGLCTLPFFGIGLGFLVFAAVAFTVAACCTPVCYRHNHYCYLGADTKASDIIEIAPNLGPKNSVTVADTKNSDDVEVAYFDKSKKAAKAEKADDELLLTDLPDLA